MDDDSGRQAGAHQSGEIEITDEMVEAARQVLLSCRVDFVSFSNDDLARELVAAVLPLIRMPAA